MKKTLIIREAKIGSITYNGPVHFASDQQTIVYGDVNCHYVTTSARTSLMVVGSFKTEGLAIIHNKLKVGESLEVGGLLMAISEIRVNGKIICDEYINQDFSVLDLAKIETNKILFTPRYDQERRLWCNLLQQDAPNFTRIVQNGACWDNIFVAAIKYQQELLNSAAVKTIPAFKQAVEQLIATAQKENN